MILQNAAELRDILKSLEKYVENAKMEVDVRKNKIMKFGGGGEVLQFQGKKIKVFNKFKYLGL